ncbi:hypothetical protein PFDSM3638_06185 [Pyrococcus furiosus DSM 3638]|uniref:PH domain-containing protein n=3 Tax=Pyrococcus furiosus TaxID=2261 RepID=A0A5C0XPG9_PYRFU|nr:hypothetical protein [Pyrococcus furiosus]AAL81363.1 hypothetical protein PF1239 [Pyrococcus furiosus DSM 3638]AFN04026.1 hypothetical protein PFC_05415 [Pyrococcus furiosus COM1]QEK78883.1 hypothetical protein PFDSM3638_06185 [Pyrococcus furiosus DSM 3638]
MEYEESIESKLLMTLTLIPFLMSIFIIGFATSVLGEEIPKQVILFVGGVFALTLIMTLDITKITIKIDDEGIKIKGRIGLLVRKRVKIEDIEYYKIEEGFLSCQVLYGFRFNLPAKACVLIKRKTGAPIVFTTNNPDEVSYALSTLGIPRAP